MASPLNTSHSAKLLVDFLETDIYKLVYHSQLVKLKEKTFLQMRDWSDVPHRDGRGVSYQLQTLVPNCH